MAATPNAHEQRLKAYADFAAGGDDVFRHRGGWADHFRHRIGPAFAGRVVLEVGSADATFLAAVAARHPAVGFVGLDWKFKAVHDGAARVAAAGLRNVALLRGRAGDLPRIFAPGELAEIWVFHPEPCAEPNQRANRLVAEPFLVTAHDLLAGDDAVVAVKTDHAGYFQWVLALAGAAEPPAFRAAREAALAVAATTTAAGQPGRGVGRPTDVPVRRVRARDLLPPGEVPPPSDAVRARFAVSAASADYWNDPTTLARTAGRCFAGAATPFEQRFVAKRRPIYYVELRKR